jgi:arylsulfatase A-like enzyme
MRLTDVVRSVRFLARSGAALVLLLAAGLLASAASGADAPRPNVLFIAVDDLNDWTGCLGGHPQTQTPNLDRLAARGLLFTNAHCAAPACNPSRAALMTGIRPSTSGVYHNPQPWRPVLREAVTLPQHFRAHGYTALGSGKIYHGSFPDPDSWDEYYPSKTRQSPGDPMPPNRPLNGIEGTAHFDWGPVDVDDAQMGDAQVADYVIAQLQRKHEKPFFLACGFYRPHLPWYVPPKYFDKFPLRDIQLPKVLADDLADVPPAGVRMARPQGDHAAIIAHQQWHRAVQGYLASINFMDAQLGRVLDALDRGPHAANTLVVLWSDHGWHLGEKEHWRKFALWERATRVPLIIVAPGVTRAGTRCAQPANLIDLYPTLAELCGLPLRAELEGTSLVPLLRQPEASTDRVSLTTHGRNNHAVRDVRYRYIRYADGSEELYDHHSDPHEWHNLAGDAAYAPIKQRLAAHLPQKNAPDAPTQRRNSVPGE